MSKSVRAFQKAQRRSDILGLIRTAGLLSRVELSRNTGLSKASVTGIIAELIEEGLVVEKSAGAYEGGRRPILLGINPDGAYAIGVNVSLEQIRVVIINFHAEVLASHEHSLSRNNYRPEEVVAHIGQAIKACMWESNLKREDISGVGLGIPGLVDASSGTIRFLPNYGWSNVPLRQMLEDEINHPVFIDNDSNNLAIAERWYGEGKGVNDFLVVTLQNGVGSGSVVHGQLLRGHLGIASEFGHMCIDPDGPLCRCGRQGCVEAYVGNNAIIRESKRLHAKGEWKGVVDEARGIRFEDVLDELQCENPGLDEVYRLAGKVLGIGLRNLITIFNPKLIILTGKGTRAGEVLFNSMYSSMESLRSGKFGSYKTKIVINDWTEEDWARGAGTLVLQEIYDQKR